MQGLNVYALCTLSALWGLALQSTGFDNFCQMLVCLLAACLFPTDLTQQVRRASGAGSQARLPFGSVKAPSATPTSACRPRSAAARPALSLVGS
eukprot:323293-Chlamydomonas_euryale.AAC.3